MRRTADRCARRSSSSRRARRHRSNFIINDGITNDGAIFAINTTLVNDANADTVAGLQINVTSAATGDADILYGLNIANLSSADATVNETALHIGTGWDIGLQVDSGLITTSNLGVEFTESDTNPTCASGNYNIFADLSETKLKKCVNGVVSDLGAGDKYETFTASGTYTKPSDAILVIVDAWGAGGGGGGGAGGTNAAARTGGGGGAGGAYTNTTFLAADVGSTVAVTIGAAGTAGTAGSGNVGGNGASGGNSCFTSAASCTGTFYAFAGGGGGGAGAGAAGNGGGGGGGQGGAGAASTSATGNGGGGPAGAAAGSPGTANAGAGGGGGGTATTTTAGANGGNASWGGGGGGASITTGVVASGGGGYSVRGGGGGGAGGSCAITTCTLRAGGAGGATNNFTSSGTAGGATAGAVGGTGTNGIGSGGWGGGGGATNAAGAGGAGGAGGNLGGGGGGGGGAHTGSTVGGAGGAGGRGEVRVWSIRGSGADLAEVYGTHDNLEPGDVVCVDKTMKAGVKKCANRYDKNAIGIISTAPGLVIGDVEDEGAKPAMVVLAGRTPTKVSNENGVIMAGDLLTPSSVPGVAMKATKAGQIIGQAMTGFDGEFSGQDQGMVMAFANTSFSQGTAPTLTATDHQYQTASGREMLTYLMGEDDAATPDANNLAEMYTDRVIAGLEIVTPKVTADKVATNELSPATNDDLVLTLGENGHFLIKNDKGETTVSFDSAGNASFNGTVTTNQRLTQAAATGDDKLVIKSLVIQNDLSLGGQLSASALSIDGPADFGGEGVFHKLVTFLDRTIFKQEVSFEERATFNNDTAGFATIRTNETEVKVKFTKPYADKPVVNLTVKNGLFIDYAYKDLDEDGFTIVLSQPTEEDVEFAWSAVAVKDVKTAVNPDPAN